MGGNVVRGCFFIYFIFTSGRDDFFWNQTYFIESFYISVFSVRCFQGTDA